MCCYFHYIFSRHIKGDTRHAGSNEGELSPWDPCIKLGKCFFVFGGILQCLGGSLPLCFWFCGARLTVEMLSMYQDHIARVISNNITDHDTDVAVDVEDAQDVVWKRYKLEIHINLY